jgi:hypothetical protein
MVGRCPDDLADLKRYWGGPIAGVANLSQTKLVASLVLATAGLLASVTLVARAPNWPVAVVAVIVSIGLLAY